MANRTLSRPSWTVEAVANAADMTADKYLALQGGSSTQLTKIKEVRVAGLEPTNAAPVILLLASDSQVGSGALTNNGTDAADHPSTAALAAPVAPFTATATNKPQRSASLHHKNLSFDALGGLFRERAPFGEALAWILGNTASFGEVSLSGYTGSSLVLVGGHIVYETE
jgi:hypothetical protein